MAHGFAYLVAIIDWYSRRVLAWRLSNALESTFCIEALQEALSRFPKPGIFNTDQGSQFTANRFTTVLRGASIAISMDGRGRCLDNVFVERVWRSLKSEEVFLHACDDLDCQRSPSRIPPGRTAAASSADFLNSDVAKTAESDVSDLIEELTLSDIENAVATAQAKRKTLLNGRAITSLSFDELTQLHALLDVENALVLKEVDEVGSAEFWNWLVKDAVPVLLTAGKIAVALL